jgi:toxin ParE1/3/4
MATYRLAATAQADIVDLLAHTEANFGELARRRYEGLLINGLRDIAADPQRIGSAARPELGKTGRSYHLRYSRDRARDVNGILHRPHHLVLYRVTDSHLLDIGRVLHDAMEIERHLPADYGVS